MAVVAYLVTLGATSAWLGVSHGLPWWIVIVLLVPLIEESARTLGAMEVRNDPPFWITFGLGYGLFEAGLKLGDMIVLYARADPITLLAALIVPMVPLALHVFLSVLVFALLSHRVPAAIVFVVAIITHAIHNASVAPLLPSDITGVVVSSIVRAALFVVLIASILAVVKRPRMSQTG
jgi:hypothetical protein